MKKLLPTLLLLALAPLVLPAATGDTTIITTHTNTNLNSPPSNDDEWVVFSNTNTSYQKIIMRFTLGCGTPNCSGWDYTVNAYLGKKNGAIDSAIAAIDTLTQDTTWTYSEHVNFTEVGRLITPYGTYMAANSNGFNSSWTHPYYYDITDFAELLKDSVSVRVHYDGWTDAFSAKIEFLFIEGPPVRTVESVREIYNMGVGYANSAGFEAVVAAKTFPVSPAVTGAKVIVTMTGHGSQGEFDPHYFHIKINGNNIYQQLLWKGDCGINAIAPQGGTWIFNRANWCPGEKVPVYEIDISPYITPGQNVSVDLDFDDYIIQSGQSASYGLSAYLVTYTSQSNNDVMMEEIIAPNNDKPHLHHNPISTTPKVVIKNMGKMPLTYAEISYWVKGGSKWYYEWTGNLAPFQSEMVTLPAFDWNGLDTSAAGRIFYAEAKWPNDVPDEYTYNNNLQSAYNITPIYDSVFFIYFRTNNHPEENWYVVRNENGDTISFKNAFAASTIHRDTLHLTEGSYSFDIFDYDSSWGSGDGIAWWLNQQENLETAGTLSFRRVSNGGIIKPFLTDFGANLHYEFTVGYPLGLNPYKTPPPAPEHNTTGINTIALNAYMHIYPNPATDLLNVQLDMSRETKGVLTVTDISGRVIQQVEAENTTHQNIAIPTGNMARGMYFVNYTSGELKLTRKVALQ